MDLGIPRVDRTQFIDLISKEYYTEYNSSKENRHKTDFLSLFHKEVDQINECISILEKGIINWNSVVESIPKLESISYCFEHFPESQPLKILNSSNIKRFLYTLIRIRRQIGNI